MQAANAGMWSRGWVGPANILTQVPQQRSTVLSQPQPACIPPARFSLTQAFAGEAGVLMSFSGQPAAPQTQPPWQWSSPWGHYSTR